MNKETFSYNAKAVNLLLLFSGWTLKLRRDCNGVIQVISAENGDDWIYITNIEDFKHDQEEYLKWRDPGDSVNHCYLLRGMQFDTERNDGLLFTSHTYIKNSMRPGGFGSYSLK